MFINAIAAIASADIALLIIIQFLFGQAIKKMWPLFMTIQLILVIPSY